MVSVIGLDSEKVQELCDAANEEVDDSERVQIANFLCPVSVLSDAVSNIVCWLLIDMKRST
jgi:malonyl CoA-acyl carrier protein transacylase